MSTNSKAGLSQYLIHLKLLCLLKWGFVLLRSRLEWYKIQRAMPEIWKENTKVNVINFRNLVFRSDMMLLVIFLAVSSVSSLQLVCWFTLLYGCFIAQMTFVLLMFEFVCLEQNPASYHSEPAQSVAPCGFVEGLRFSEQSLREDSPKCTSNHPWNVTNWSCIGSLHREAISDRPWWH